MRDSTVLQESAPFDSLPLQGNQRPSQHGPVGSGEVCKGALTELVTEFQ